MGQQSNTNNRNGVSGVPMKRAVLKLDTTRAGQTKAGLVFAGLSVQLNGRAFPDEAWTDAVVIVLAWWAEAAIRLLRGETGPIEVRFMEGPYVVAVRSCTENAWELSLVEKGLQRRSESTKVEAAPLIFSIADACDAVLDLCRSRNWWSADAQTLAGAVANLRSQALGLRTERGNTTASAGPRSGFSRRATGIREAPRPKGLSFSSPMRMA